MAQSFNIVSPRDLSYNKSGDFDFPSPCNSFTVFNQGTTIVTVNNVIKVNPNRALVFSLAEGLLYQYRATISFADDTDIGNDVVVSQQIVGATWKTDLDKVFRDDSKK